MDRKRVLLVGGSGFVGQSLARKLVSAGCDVVLPVRHFERVRFLRLLRHTQLVEANLNESGVLERLMDGVDCVVNLAGILHDPSCQPNGHGDVSLGAAFSAVHVELPRRITSAMQAKGVRRLVHVSALKASEVAPSAYLRSKAAGENVVLNSDLDVTVYRPSVIFGANDRFINAFAELLELLPILPLARAESRLQPVFLGDVVDELARSVLTPLHPHPVYALTGPHTYSLKELVAYVKKLIGSSCCVVSLPDSLGLMQATVLGWVPGAPMDRDNFYSLGQSSVLAGELLPQGWQPNALESIVPTYLGKERTGRARFCFLRAKAGRLLNE